MNKTEMKRIIEKKLTDRKVGQAMKEAVEKCNNPSRSNKPKH